MSNPVIELKPCPFCGNSASFIQKVVSIHEIYWDVACDTEKCYLGQGSDWYFQTQQEVSIMWNNRKEGDLI